MLSLRRYPGEKLFIGPNITIQVGKVTGKVVQLLINAPDLLVDRPEKEQDLADREAYRQHQLREEPLG